MPTYLLHGFRWPRPLIRIHIILQNLDDAAAEWLCSPLSSRALLSNFRELFPNSMPHLPNLRFIEQYDPDDLSAASLSQPFAYVADVVEEVKLGVDIDEVRGRGVGNEQWGALMELRDRLAPDEKVGWWVVVCGDEERWAPPTNDLTRGGFSINQTPSQAQRLSAQSLGNGNPGNGDRGRENGRNFTAPVTRSAADTSGAARDDPGLRELRQQTGYRTESDASETSSGGASTVYNVGSPASRGGEKGTAGDRTSASTQPPSPKKSGVRRWLSKRKR